ncbi:MAG TPA: NAD(P)H-dependent oxidoreductase [Bryobacteraceae bacterium]|jgi:NAD(P)H-dependent FMN reductase
MPLHLAVIIGSTRKGRRAPVVANWFADRARQHSDLHVDVIDIAEARLPEELSDTPPAEVAAFGRRLAAADAFVVVVPEYNHSFPAPLKNAIDWTSRGWKAKPIGFVSYGGRSGGLRAVEQLRQVFAELHAIRVRDSVSFHDVWTQFESTAPRDPEGCAAAAKTMLSQLEWFGSALKEARLKSPYGF